MRIRGDERSKANIVSPGMVMRIGVMDTNHFGYGGTSLENERTDGR